MSSDGPSEEAAESFLERLQGEDSLAARPDPTGAGHPTRPDTGAGDGRPAEGRRQPAPPRLDDACPVTPAIRDADLRGVAHVGPPLERRFGTERRLRTGDVPARVDVRAFRAPGTDTDGFGGALRAQLDRWAELGDIEGVVPALDHGVADRPWVVTPSIGPSLGGRDTPSLRRALRQTLHLADALVTLHDRGVVHAGVDPRNIVFTVGRDGPPRAAFHNPGLVDVYRRYEDPAGVLDPRYAAPEFFGEDLGVVDRTTDVYGVGAVCYRLVVGVPPVSGSAEAIADRVTADEPFAAPSSVEPGVPEALDDVLVTATATDPFERYETAREFRAALATVLDGLAE